jgi:hypothetical protein
VALPERGIGEAPRRLALSGGWTARMAEVGARVELEERLAELERLRSEGSLTEIGYNLQRNLLITRSDELARRRSAAPVIPLPHAPSSRRAAPPSRRAAPPSRGAAPPSRGAATSSRGVAPTPTRLVPLSRRAGAPARAQAPRAGRGWARLVSRPALLAAAVILVAAVAFGVYHATSGPATAASATAAHPPGGGGAAPTAAPSPSASATSAPAPPPTVIDVTQATLSGGSVTLLGYADHFASGSSINNPLPSGGFYAAVELRICAGPGASTIVSQFQFLLTEPDQTQVGIQTGPTVGRQPALSLQPLSAGSCTTGWLSYGVTTRPATLDDTGDSLTWTIPS